jgi:maleate isomerase
MHNNFRRIGVLMPPGNVSCEREFTHFAPSGTSVQYSRLYRKTVAVDKEGLLSMIQSAETGAKALAQAGVELILYACTSGSFLSGPGREDEIGEMIRNWTGLPGYTTSTSVIRAVQTLGMKRIYMLTPYPDDIHAQEMDFFGFRGITVVAHDTFRCSDTVQIRDISSEQVAERLLARRADIAGCDGVFVSCTNLLGMDQVERLEQALGVPVTTSNHCTLWMALTHMGIPTRGLGLGRLYDAHSPVAAARVAA